MNNEETQVKPLYHVNVTYGRKAGVYRSSFLVGRQLAPAQKVEARLAAQDDHLLRDDDKDTSRLFTGSWSQISKATEAWMRQNREALEKARVS